MSFDLGQLLTDLTPTLISAGVGAATNYAQGAIGDKVYDQYGNERNAATATLNQGFDDQLAQLEKGFSALTGLNEERFAEVAAMLGMAPVEFAQILYPAIEQYSGYLTGSSDQFGEDMGQLTGNIEDILSAGSDAYGEQLGAWDQGGRDALGYYQQELAKDPYTLNMQQQRAADRFDRDAVATLAASGLRGAGRAGVAALQEGKAANLANLYAQNENNQRAAAAALGASGFSAAGNIATNKQALADAIGDLNYKTGMSAATDARDTTRNIAATTLAGKQSVADKVYGTNRDVANLKANQYDNQSQIEAGKYGARGDTALAKAQSSAATANDLASANMNNNAVKAAGNSSLVGQIGAAINDAVKKQQQAGTGAKVISTSTNQPNNLPWLNQ